MDVNQGFTLNKHRLKPCRKLIEKILLFYLNRHTHKVGVLVRQGGLSYIAIWTYTLQTVFRAIICFISNTMFLCRPFKLIVQS